VPDQLSHPRSPLPWERGSGSSSSIVSDEEPRVTGTPDAKPQDVGSWSREQCSHQT